MVFDYQAAMQRVMGSGYGETVQGREQKGIAKYGNKHMFMILNSSSPKKDAPYERWEGGKQLSYKKFVLVGEDLRPAEEQKRQAEVQRLLKRLYALEIIDSNYEHMETILNLGTASLVRAHKYITVTFGKA